MKKFYRMSVIGAFMATMNLAFAQEPVKLGSVSEFMKSNKQAVKSVDGKPGLLKLEVGGTPLTASFKIHESKKMIGTIQGSPGSNVFITEKEGIVNGRIVMNKEKKAYEYYTENGTVYVRKTSIDKVVCTEYDVDPAPSKIISAIVPPAGDPVYSLQSLAGAGAVVMLDFDGQVVPNSIWDGGNSITAVAGNFTAGEITEIWNMVSEDYRPFNINVTTNEATYNSAPVNRRIRVIFTPTNYFYPGAGGVAYLGSFTWGDNTPCWVFNGGVKGAGEAASHEAGHTFNLSHDGRTTPAEGYYYGQGVWAPIMGVGYNRSVVQWSKGEYTAANNTQDDIAIITNATNGVTFRTDDHGNTLAAATNIVASASVNASGVISQTTDIDLFKFTTIGGTVTLNLNPATFHPNLNISARILNSAGTAISTSNPVGLPASFSVSLGAGTYYLELDGVGENNPATDGYSDYGSLGAYTITGSIPGCGSTFEPNETLAAAIAMPFNSTLNSAIGTLGDVDYFSVVVNTPCTFNITLTGLVRDYDLNLYNSVGTYVAGSAAGGSTSETINYTVTAAGTYFIRVYGYAGAFGPECYTLKNMPVFPCTNAFEPNETIATATATSLNSYLNAGITSATDLDHYSRVISVPGLLVDSLTSLPLDYDLAFLNASGVTLKSSANGGTTPDLVSYNVADPGTYYSKVYGYNGNNSPYCYLLANRFVPGACAETGEPNESTAAATYMAVNSSKMGRISTTTDSDYSVFTTAAGATNVQIKLSNLAVDFDVQLYNSAGVLLASSALGGAASETINYTNSVAATYYVRVYGWAGNTHTQCYVLKVNAGSSPFLRVATDMLSDQDMKDIEETESSLSFHPNPANAGSNLTVEITSPEQGISSIKILDMNGVVLSEQSVSANGKSSISLQGIAPGVYVLDAGNAGKKKLVIQ